MRLRNLILPLLTVFLFTLSSSAYAQEVYTATRPAPDPIEELRLTPEQRQKIRMIFEENKDERQQANRALRQANVALDKVLDAEPVDQGLLEQRISEVALAQTAQLRMRIQTEMKIRRELRPEQLTILREMRLQMRDFAERPLSERPVVERLRRNPGRAFPRQNKPQP
jgi:Spy/CpxP family protein refolding chaperone